MRRGFRLAAAALLAAALPASAGPPTRPAIPRSAEFVDSVNGAIDRGVAWLREAGGPLGVRKHDYPDFEGGLTAFVTYTMRACGVARDDRMVREGLESLRATWKAQRTVDHRTYVVALMCMAAAEDDPGQAPAAGTTDRASRPLPGADLEWLRQMVRWLESVQHGGGWSYSVDGGYDLSNTQYALLGLRSAARRGVVVNSSTWRSALNLYLTTQESSGPSVLRFVPTAPGTTTDARFVDRARGWCYDRGAPPYGSMTAGAVGSLCICRAELARSNRVPQNSGEIEHAIRDGIAWLGENFSVTENPGPGSGPRWSTVHYHLYGVERAGVLADVEWMGEHDWYGEGAAQLVSSQNSTGCWSSVAVDSDAVLSTCCALLFLKRGTHPIRTRPVVTTASAVETSINFDAVANLSRNDFDDFIDLLVAKWSSATEAEARERLAAKATSVGPRIVEPLVARLTSAERREREAAFALLSRATGLAFDYDPAAPEAALESAAGRWQAWLIANESRLVLDPAKGRIVAK